MLDLLRASSRRLADPLTASAVLVLVAFLTAVLGLALLHTPPGRTALRVFVESWGSRATGGTLRLGQLQLALWKGHAGATAGAWPFQEPGSRCSGSRSTGRPPRART